MRKYHERSGISRYVGCISIFIAPEVPLTPGAPGLPEDVSEWPAGELRKYLEQRSIRHKELVQEVWESLDIIGQFGLWQKTHGWKQRWQRNEQYLIIWYCIEYRGCSKVPKCDSLPTFSRVVWTLFFFSFYVIPLRTPYTLFGCLANRQSCLIFSSMDQVESIHSWRIASRRLSWWIGWKMPLPEECPKLSQTLHRLKLQMPRLEDWGITDRVAIVVLISH